MERDKIIERLDDTGDRILGNGGFSVVGESAIAFAALLKNAARSISQEPRWIPVSESKPEEGQHILIGGYGNKGKFYAEAVYRGEEWLMFDQVTDHYCHPCQYPSYWMPIAPLPAAPEAK